MILRFGIFLFLICSSFGSEKIGPYTLDENLNYTIHWGLFHVGDSQFKTNLIEAEDGTKEILVHFSSKSRGLANTLYTVDSETSVYIDPDTLKTKRVERKVDEGDYLAESTLYFNYETMQVRWQNHTLEEIHEYELPPDTTDFYSLLYRLRDGLPPGQTSATAKVAVDDKVHELKIIIDGEDDLKIKGKGKQLCTRLRVEPLTEGLFVRKIPEEVWISQGEPSRVEKMDVRVPLGTVSVKYQPELNRE